MSAAERPGAPRVLVVIPAYEAESFVAAAVRSALAQTMRHLQVVVVDDGSSDRTAEAARCADERVTVIRWERRGPSAARNRAVAACSGAPFVAFLDADDEWDPGKLAAQLLYVERHPELGAVGCYMRYISPSGEPLGVTGQMLNRRTHGRVARGELLPFPLSSLLVRTEVFLACGGFDDVLGLQGAEDLDLYARIARLTPIDCVPLVLGSYRLHPASAMARERVRINRATRFVRRRLAMRDKGHDLTWSEFEAAYVRSLPDRRQDFVERLYRGGALSYSQGRYAQAGLRIALATLIAPGYTVPRLLRQRLLVNLQEHRPARRAAGVAEQAGSPR